MTATPSPDWISIEADYRAGSMSVRELSRFYGIPESTMRAKACKEGWTRKARHLDLALEMAKAKGLRRRSAILLDLAKSV